MELYTWEGFKHPDPSKNKLDRMEENKHKATMTFSETSCREDCHSLHAKKKKGDVKRL